MIARIRSKSAQTDFKAGALAEFGCEVIGSRPPPKITWHLVSQSNTIIDLVSKKHPSNGQSPGHSSSSNVQIILDDETHLGDEYAIFQHPLPSTNHQAKLFKSSANQPAGQSFVVGSGGAGNHHPHFGGGQGANVNNLNVESLSATSATKLVAKQPFIFTIDYPLLSQDGNTSSSVLKLRLSQRMHLNRIVCRATNYEVQRDSELEDQQLLNILCKYYLLSERTLPFLAIIYLACTLFTAQTFFFVFYGN